MDQQPGILIVEDDVKVAAALQQGLSAEGFRAEIESTGDGALSRLARETFDVVLLDLTLPAVDGLQILSAFREKDVDTRVLIMTGRDGIPDRVLGLDRGADDYVSKPFVFAELLARIRALLRRGPARTGRAFQVGNLQIDTATRTVMRNGKRVELTLVEFDLLERLLRSAGQIVSREELVAEIWNETARSTTLDNIIDVHVARLRRKLDDGPVSFIRTVRGIGFIAGEPVHQG